MDRSGAGTPIGAAQPAAAGHDHRAKQFLVIADADADGGGDDAARQKLAGMAGQHRVVGHEFDICMAPFSGRYDPDGNMFFYFTKDGPNNFAAWRDDDVTGLLVKARSSADRAERAKLYHQAQDRVGDQALMLFLHFDAIIQASSAKLQWTQYPDAVFRLFDARMT